MSTPSVPFFLRLFSTGFGLLAPGLLVGGLTAEPTFAQPLPPAGGPPTTFPPPNAAPAPPPSPPPVNNPTPVLTPGDLPLDPTQSNPAPLSIPATFGGSTLMVVGQWEALPLPLATPLVDLSILGVMWPEPLFLLDPFGSTTVLYYQITAPGAVDPAALTEPDSPGGTPNVDPDTLARVGAGASGSIQNCQTQVRQIRETQARDRNQAIYDSLIACYQQNLDVAIALENSEWTAYSLNNLAVSYFVVGDYLKAIELHQQQLEAAQASGDSVQAGIALSGLGAAHAALGDYDAAIEFYTQSLPLIRIDAAPQWRSLTLRNLGNAHYALQDYDIALHYQQESLALTQSTGDRFGSMQTLGNLGNLYTVQGNYQTATQAYQQSLSLAKDLDNALEVSQSLLGLGTVYAHQQDFANALDYYQQSLTLMGQLGARLGEGIALSNVGEALFRLNRLTEAEHALFEAVAVWESLRAGLGTHDNFKVSIFETQLMAYRDLQAVLVANNNIEKALEVAERGRARAFVELLARGQGRTDRVAAPPTIDQLRQVAIRQQATLVEYTIVRDQFADTPHGASPQSKQAPQESALLIWVVQPSGQVSFRQVDLTAKLPDRSLSKVVESARDRNRVSSRGFATRLGSPFEPATAAISQQWQQLHTLLIDPIAELLPTDPEAPVIFIPQEQLFLVPFAALQNSEGEYLVEHHTILTAPAIQIVALTQPRPSTALGSLPTPALIVGNPTPMPEPLPALPLYLQK
jgi:tetratricopeptide (TPR) repeat protein